MRNISKRFPGTQALSKVDLDLHAGEILGLVGANGAGKSTLTKILSGALSPDEGEIVLKGEPVEFSSAREAIRAGISEAYQESTLVPDLTGWQNIFLGQENTRYGFVENQKLKDKGRELTERVGVDIDLTKRPSQLSVGKRKILEILRALSQHPSILILDEPTASLTVPEAETLFELQRSLKDQGLHILFISHYIDEIFEVTDRVAVLRNGELVGVRPTSELNQSDVVDMMLEQDFEEQYQEKPEEIGSTVLRLEDFNTESLSGVNLELRAGEIVGLAGVVGAGRTELIESIVGDRPYDGTMEFNGDATRIHSPAEARRRGIFLVPEDRHVKGLFTELPVNMNLGVTIYDRISQFGLIRTQLENDHAESIVSELRIKCNSIFQDVRFLSGGNQQKVSFGKWLIQAGEDLTGTVFLLDKPTEGIDVGAKTEFYRLIFNLAKQGAGILLVSSELDELLNLSHRIYALSRGSLVEEFDAGRVTKHQLQETMG